MMKIDLLCLLVTLGIVLLTGTAVGEGTKNHAVSPGEVQINFKFTRQSVMASNQFAVWIEDLGGKVVKTVFVTRFTGAGGFAIRENSLPVWVKKAKPDAIDEEEIDSVTGATPKSDMLTYIWDCTDRFGNPVPAGEYQFFVEGTLHWEDDVLFSGTIPVGGENVTVQATARYSTDEPTYRNMVRKVSASFVKK